VLLVLAILSIWPRPYVATTLLAPDDSASALSGLFGGGGGGNALAALLGGHGTLEADLLIGRSQAVVGEVARELQAQGLYRTLSEPRLEVRLHKKVEVEAVRGSVLKLSLVDHDSRRALKTIQIYARVMKERLTALSRNQAAEKRVVARERLEEATGKLELAQANLNAFRAVHTFTSADVQLGSALGTQAGLQAELEATQVAVQTLERFEGPENIQVQASQQRIGVLQRQIADLRGRGMPAGDSLAKLNPELSHYNNLVRDQRYAETEYDIYRRYFDNITVQQVAAPLNMDVIDPPALDPDRHFNAAPLALLVLVVLFGIVAEFYLYEPRVRTVRSARFTPEPASVGLQSHDGVVHADRR
jgi:uncharacterized protein involved in exopolysaccharide biosynthesis